MTIYEPIIQILSTCVCTQYTCTSKRLIQINGTWGHMYTCMYIHIQTVDPHEWNVSIIQIPNIYIHTYIYMHIHTVHPQECYMRTYVSIIQILSTYIYTHMYMHIQTIDSHEWYMEACGTMMCGQSKVDFRTCASGRGPVEARKEWPWFPHQSQHAFRGATSGWAPTRPRKKIHQVVIL